MMAFVITIHVVACITLISVILLQAGRGHGLAGSSFGSEMNTVFGTKTAKFMTKLTTTCAVLFLVTCVTIDVLISMRSRSIMPQNTQGVDNLSQAQLDEVMAKLKVLQAEKEAEAGAVAEEGEAIAADGGVVLDKIAEKVQE